MEPGCEDRGEIRVERVRYKLGLLDGYRGTINVLARIREEQREVPRCVIFPADDLHFPGFRDSAAAWQKGKRRAPLATIPRWNFDRYQERPVPGVEL